MFCRITDLRDKDVINIKDGCRLGCVSDVEVDTCSGRICAIVVLIRRGFGFWGGCDEIIIKWEHIQVIGDDTILVCHEPSPIIKEFKRGGFWNRLWG